VTAPLNPEEVDALMSAIQEGRVDPKAGDLEGGKVVPYDLTSRDRIIRGQMPTLDAIHEQIASVFGSSLAGRTRMRLQVTCRPATLMKVSDVQVMLAPPAVVAVITLGPSNGDALIVLEGDLADALLAAALGDRKMRPEKSDEPLPETRRELTSVEKQVLKRLLSMFTDAMRDAWSLVLPFKPEVSRFESDPRLANVAPPNEAAILATFEMSGAINGSLQLAVPFAAVEPAKRMLSAQPRSHAGADARFTQALTQELCRTPVELCAILGKTVMTLEQLLSLETGAVLTLDTDEGSPVPVLVQGRPKLTGVPRVTGGGIGVVIDRADLTPGPGSGNDDERAA
jgi:flagellar motor switch protein FliM